MNYSNVFHKTQEKNKATFYSGLTKASCDGVSNLDSVDLQRPFKWNFMFCLCLFYSKVPDVLMRTKEKNPCSQSCMQVNEKTVI